MLRLHIDIPLDYDLETAKKIGLDVVYAILDARAISHAEKVILNIDYSVKGDTIEPPEEPEFQTYLVSQVNYRLGDDTDRQRSNYYIMDSNGHVTHKKCAITFSNDGVPQPRTE